MEGPQILVHLATQFQRRRFFRNRPIRNNNCLWWPCLLTNRDQISKFIEDPYGPSDLLLLAVGSLVVFCVARIHFKSSCTHQF
jgi:hypothetical protein